MSTSTAITMSEQKSVGRLGRLADYAELTKPRILVMVLIAVATSAVVATWGQPDVTGLFHTLVATALVAASASALNQWWERDADAKMPRTRQRPLPAGRLTTFETIAFSAVSVTAGLVYLLLACGVAPMIWAVLTWLLYVFIYTPMKRRTALNTAIGAIPGAMPILIGWTAAGGSLDARALSLFLLLFLWQFPHFMAIAWLYREQYASAGMFMLTVVDPSGRRAGVQSVLAALSLILVGLVPLALTMSSSPIYVVGSFCLGLSQLICSAQFLVNRCDATARRLLRASLIYLPLQLALVTLLSLAVI